jgi:hypothetical protein
MTRYQQAADFDQATIASLAKDDDGIYDALVLLFAALELADADSVSHACRGLARASRAAFDPPERQPTLSMPGLNVLTLPADDDIPF